MVDEHLLTERVNIALTRAAAVSLIHWLASVPTKAIPVTEPSERQALADLVTQLEVVVGEPEEPVLVAAREMLLRGAGDWVYEGAVYTGEAAD